MNPIKANLRFIFATLFEHHVLNDVNEIKLDIFEDVVLCEELRHNLTQRQVQGERLYAIFLLIKKILVFLSSERSLREKKYQPPILIPSFVFVDSVCGEASEVRKKSAQNRHLLGRKMGKDGIEFPKQFPSATSVASLVANGYESAQTEAKVCTC